MCVISQKQIVGTCEIDKLHVNVVALFFLLGLSLSLSLARVNHIQIYFSSFSTILGTFFQITYARETLILITTLVGL